MLKPRYSSWIQILLFLVILYCATWPIQVFLLVVAGLFSLFLHQRYWLWEAWLFTFLAFFLFSPQIMRMFENVLGLNARFTAPLPKLIQKSSVENPVISIVIPAYNYEEYVGEAVKTAATQKFNLPYEVVIIDDGSSDGTLTQILDISKDYPHITVYHNAHNMGLITTKNTGIALAKGEWIYNLDADDYMAPDALSALYSLTNSEDKGDFIFSTLRLFGEIDRLNYFCFGVSTLNYSCVPNSALYRKDDWRQLGPYSYLFRKGLEDWDFSMAFAEAQKKIILAERPVHFGRLKKHSRTAIANKHTDELWWNIQAKYAQRLPLRQRLEVILCGFYRFYLKVIVEDRLPKKGVLYKLSKVKS